MMRGACAIGLLLCMQAAFAQQGLPLRVGFLEGVVHEEQLMEMCRAQSGGNPACASKPG